MKMKVIGIVICIVLILPLFSISKAADPTAQLEIRLIGGLPLPFLFHYVGGVITNSGDTAVYNISYKLTIHGGILGTTDETLTGDTDEILPQNAYAVGMFNVYGFGRVTVTLVVSASNAANVTGTAQGLQIGGFTWIPFSWVTS